MKHYPVPSQPLRREMKVVNSLFIASLEPVFNVDEAKAFINRMRAEFADATHNVPVYLIGYGASVIAHCSDDGEPSGTAGRPALAVLRGSGLGDVAVVVTRYFGGTKLGTGGLVRAYSDAVRMVIDEVPRAEKLSVHTVMLELPYARLEQVRLLVAAHDGVVLDETFGADITMTARFASERFDGFQSALQELSNGSLQAEILEIKDAVFPIPASPSRKN